MNLQRPSTKKKTVQTLSQLTKPEYCTPKSTKKKKTVQTLSQPTNNESSTPVYKKKKNSPNPKSTLQAKSLNAQVTN